VQLGLRHAVLTMVTRDDLDDGGAAHVAATVRAIRAKIPDATVEVLTSDFAGRFHSAAPLLAEHPEIFAHNIETVRSLSPLIRSRATYERSLGFLRQLKGASSDQITKSSLMVGLGETHAEVLEALHDLHGVGVSMVTIGQYLQPTPKQVRVKEWIHPDLFAKYEEAARAIGITDVVAGPFVRSSYRSHPLQRVTS
jgi:lipoic acid synthetase